jgi:hypothetical protein
MTTQYVACKVMAAKYILIRFFRKFYAYPPHNMWDTLNSIPFWCLLLHRYFPSSLLNRDFVTVHFPWPCVTIISYSYFNSQVSTIICTRTYITVSMLPPVFYHRTSGLWKCGIERVQIPWPNYTYLQFGLRY